MRTYGIEAPSASGVITYPNVANPGFFGLVEWGTGAQNANANITVRLFRASGGVTPTDDTVAKFNSRSPTPQNTPAVSWATNPTNQGSALLQKTQNYAGPPSDWLPPRPWAIVIFADGEQGQLQGGSGSAVVPSDAQWIEEPMVPDARSRPARRCGRRRDCHVWVSHTNQLQKKTGAGAYEFRAPSALAWSAPLPVFVPDHIPDWMQRFGGVGGETFFLTADGATTPAGVLLKRADKIFPGQASPVGDLLKLLLKTFVGQAGPTGALTKTVLKAFVGATSPVGDLVANKIKTLAVGGVVGPVGDLLKQAGKLLGAVTITSGALAKLAQVARAGTVAPAGALAKTTQDLAAGAAAAAGGLSKVAQKTVSGSTTFEAFQPDFVQTDAFQPATEGLVGALVKVPGKALAGAATPSGALTRTAAKILAGLVSPSGSVTKLIGRAFAGAMTAIGTVANVVLLPAEPFEWAVGRLSVKWDAHTLQVKWGGKDVRTKWRGGSIG